MYIIESEDYAYKTPYGSSVNCSVLRSGRGLRSATHQMSFREEYNLNAHLSSSTTAVQANHVCYIPMPIHRITEKIAMTNGATVADARLE